MQDFRTLFHDSVPGRSLGFRWRFKWFAPAPATDDLRMNEGRMTGSPYWIEQLANPYLAMYSDSLTIVRNNPAKTFPETVWLVYVDPDGKFIGLAFQAMAFVGVYLSNGINGYGWSAKQAYNEISGVLQFPVYQNENTIITAGIDPFAFATGMGQSPYFLEYGNFTEGFYGHTGYFNRYSLYGR